VSVASSRVVTIRRRACAGETASLVAAGLSPLFARLYGARGVVNADETRNALSGLPPPAQMLNAGRAAVRIADAIRAGERILIVADYDADGATACAVGVRALRAFGARVDFLVPNRFEYGYGLTPEIVALAATREPRLLITVDNGIASVDGVAAANARGIDVVVTDHHLPGPALPDACCIVNPNQPGCAFPSQHIAGVGVMFYVLLALRQELRRRHGDDSVPFKLASLLDLVALGTVADVVRLDALNRIFVAQGLARMRAGAMQPGLAALFAAAGRDPARATTYELGYLLGPRLNAAGRLADMTVGIRCLTTDDPADATALALQLDRLNRERREIESDMTAEALAELDAAPPADAYAITLFRPDWHPGVIGLLAARVKEKWHRPAIVFARNTEPGRERQIRGSGRSIDGFHLRDALDLVAKREPDLLHRFGGHAMAAGVTLDEAALPRFAAAFEAVARERLDASLLAPVIESDGPLGDEKLSIDLAETLRAAVWGQGFPPPTFDDSFVVAEQRWVGGRHLRLRLASTDGTRQACDAIAFNQPVELPGRVRAVFRLDVNEYQGTRALQLVIEHWEAC
jgi:single-stranded-DNA-specific exonuclease